MVQKLLKEKVYHCALDDTIDVLEEINKKAGDLQSIFDVEVMGILKKFHEEYGTKFSLYLFYEKKGGFNLSLMTDKFRAEWQKNSNWLKLSFHARIKKGISPDFYYRDADYQTARDDFILIKNEILRFAGPGSWDNYPRTHYWAGSREAVKAWRDCGIKGLYYSCPGYPALYFSEAELKNLWEKDFWYDPEMKLFFITTNVKLPCSTVAEIEKVLAGLDNRRIVEIFCDDYNLLELRAHMDKAIGWASAHGYRPVFYEEVFG